MSTDTVAAEPSTEPAEPAGPAPDERQGITFEALAIIAMVLAFAAVIVAVFAVGLASRAIDEHRAIPAGGSGGGPVAVHLTEFAISPAPISAGAGGTLQVTNDGNTTHDLSVEDQDVATAILNGGESESLDLGPLEAGTYTVFCSIPGHRESGMETSLTVG